MTARKILSGLLVASMPTLLACSDTAAVPVASLDAIAAGEASFNRGGRQGTVVRSLNGEFAESFGWVSVPNGEMIYFYLSVARQGPGANAATWLDVWIERCAEPEECTLQFSGSGPIPRTDFTGNLQRGFTLETDTRMNPQFIMWEGAGGTISVSWSPTGALEFRESGSTEYVSQTWSMHRSGTRRYSHASAAGVVFDIPLVASAPGAIWGAIGTYRGVQKTFSADEPE